MVVFDFIKNNFTKIGAFLSIVATILSVSNYIISFKDRKKKMKQNNRDLFYRPLSVRLGFSEKIREIPCIDENEYLGFYSLKPLEMMCFQGYFKSVRLFLTDSKGHFSMKPLSLSLEELTEIFERKEPYKEKEDLGISMLVPNYRSNQIMVMYFYILLEDFLGNMQTFMVWYAFDEKKKQMIACDVLDYFVLLDRRQRSFVIDDVSQEQNNEINIAVNLGIECYSDLLSKIKKLKQ